MIGATVEAYGRLDVVFNNAGIAQTKPFLELEDADWHRMMEVNAYGVFMCMQEVARRMIDQGEGGKIINTASTAGKQAFSLSAHYCASKFAVVALTQSGARAWGADGITVNAFCPGIVETEMWHKLNREYQALPTSKPGTTLADVNPDFPIGRFSTPDDIVGLAAFLASGDSDYMTGQAVTSMAACSCNSGHRRRGNRIGGPMPEPWTGGCQCGAVRYEIEPLEVLTLYCCHCRECQRQAASGFGMSMLLRRRGFRLLRGALRNWSRPADSGGVNCANFCPSCGVRIFHEGGEGSAVISLKAGSLDDTGGCGRSAISGPGAPSPGSIWPRACCATRGSPTPTTPSSRPTGTPVTDIAMRR